MRIDIPANGFELSLVALRPELLGFFRRRAASDAEDLASDTVLAVWLGRDRYRGEASVRTYAFRIAYRMLQRRTGRTRRAQARVANTEPDQVAGDVQQAPLLHEHEVCGLSLALARLTDAHRELLSAYGGGRTQHELSQLLGVPAGSVSRHVRAAVHALRDALHALAHQHSVSRHLPAIDREAWERVLERSANQNVRHV